MSLDTLQFARPWALLLLALIPVGAWLLRRARRTVLRVPSAREAQVGEAGLAVRLRWLPATLRAAALALVVVAVAGPRVRDARAEELSVEGIDVVIALDVSTSMRAADFKPNNRLYVAKQVISDFIQARTNDRIGLVVFAGEAYTQAPLTLDYRVLEDVLQAVRMGVIEDGTAIGNALAVSLNRLRESDASSKVVILVTDGDSNAGNIAPTEAAAIAQRMGVRIYTIMVGRGGRVPYPAGQDIFGRTAYQQVEIPVNPELLKGIAATTGGRFYLATDRESLEANFQRILDELEKSRLMDTGGFEQYAEAFPAALLPALGLLLLELLLSSTRLRTFP